MTRITYPHTIDNGHGERLTFLRRAPGVTGERVEVENVVAPGAGPPMHTHLLQEECLTVQQGTIGYQRAGGPEEFAGVGDTVCFKPGDTHRFWNAGTDDLRCTGYIEPVDNIEYFLSEIFASQARTGGLRPDPFDAAFLARRYRSEFRLADIPALVQRLVFPMVVVAGKMLGKYARYADAPTPVTR
ncbi:MAG TPA: cupin domain-containing protein [Gemmatimonadaceae bacterium]|nr:cupin domain-containing protein [Gemmatimonadaceae bacterium]